MNCRFCQLIQGTMLENYNGSPWQILRQTNHTVAFLAADQPNPESGHVLVIPKDHYQKLEHLPLEVRHTLINEVCQVSAALDQLHPACNILLNNGREAGQHEPHLHIHVIPREVNDHVLVDDTSGPTLSEAEFQALFDRVQKVLDSKPSAEI